MGISSKIFWSYLCFLLVSPSANQEIITAKIGESVILPCHSPNNNILAGVEWSRPDLEPEYVLLLRDEQIDPDGQHSSFEDRVDLKDRQMKDGDVSLNLEIVRINDTGTYNCYVFSRGANREKRAISDLKPISSVYLHVVPPGQTGGQSGDGGDEDGSVGLIGGHGRGHFPLIASLSVICVVCILYFVFVKYFHPTRDKATDTQLA